MKEAATILQDIRLLAKIANVDFIAKEVKYHHSCRKAYLSRAERTRSSTKEMTDYATKRETHDQAFIKLEQST